MTAQYIVLYGLTDDNANILWDDGNLYAVSGCCTVNVEKEEDLREWVCGACGSTVNAFNPSRLRTSLEIKPIYSLEKHYLSSALKIWLSIWTGYDSENIQVSVKK